MSDDDLAEITKRAILVISGVMYGPGELIAAVLKPTQEDYAAVFIGDAAKRAQEGYRTLWDQPPQALARSANAQIRIVTKLARDIVASDAFPGGYRKIAHMLVPDVPWCRFKIVANGGKELIAYDGLVARGDRFAWFPKPWRTLEELGD